jgi:anti-sigma regulatory factor (Ser/Thr protein kinase)
MEPMRRALRRDVEAVRRSRRDVRAYLIEAGCSPSHADAVAFVVGELVTESVEHGAGELVTLAMQLRDGHTRAEVSDGASLAEFRPSLRRRSVEGMSLASGVTDISGGRMLWAEVE